MPGIKPEIEKLYLEMYSMLFEYARSSLSSDALAEEAVQETFCIACKKVDALCNSPNPKGWLVNTLKNIISNMKRHRSTVDRVLREYVASKITDIIVTENNIKTEILFNDIADTEEFQLLKELALDGLSYLEMAQKRGISVVACRKRVQRAKEKLQKKIQL